MTWISDIQDVRNQLRLNLLELAFGRYVALLCCRRLRAHAPMSNTTSNNSRGKSYTLACVASVPVPRERNWGRAKEFFRIRAARKMRREQKSGKRVVGEGKGGNACRQTPRF